MDRILNLILLIFFFGSSIAIIFVKFILNYPATWKHGEAMGDVVFNLAVGFITSYLFYILVVIVPDLKKKKLMYGNISSALSRVLSGIKFSLQNIIKIPNFNSVDEMNFKDLCRGINTKDEGPDLLVNDGSKGTIGFYLNYQREYVMRHIAQIYNTPFLHDTELIIILDKIKNSAYHEILYQINSLYKLENNNQFDCDLEYWYSEMFIYYNLFFELKNFMLRNKINVEEI
jgi:hypothetical protein